MRKLSVKFALLSARLTGVVPVPAQFAEEIPCDDPLGQVQAFKQLIGEADQGVLLFGFSDYALVDILNEEFEVDADRGQLVFRKPFLDARSVQLAAGRLQNPHAHIFSRREEALVESLADWLFEATRTLYRDSLDDDRIADIRFEYAECIRVYAEKKVVDCDPDGIELLLRALRTSPKAMSALMHAMTVDAMFKADAARIIFGEESAYAQAWYRKQIFRHMMCKAVDQHMHRCALQAP